MTPPPDVIDGARILCWTSATDQPFYYLKDGLATTAVTGFAIGQFAFSECFQLFTCDGRWMVINERDALSLQEAMALAASQARSHQLVWHRG